MEAESTLVKMPHCWKSHDTAHILFHCVDLEHNSALTSSTILMNKKHLPQVLFLPAKSDSEAMFCLQSYPGLIIDRSLV